MSNTQDEDKTKGQLIEELVAMRQRFAQLEISTTQCQQVESALHKSEERFRLLFEEVKDYAIFTLDPNGYVASWNNGAESILGYPEAEIIGQHGSCIFTPEDRTEGEDKKELRTALAVGRAEEERWHVGA
jgi:PAS domain-containing protein